MAEFAGELAERPVEGEYVPDHSCRNYSFNITIPEVELCSILHCNITQIKESLISLIQFTLSDQCILGSFLSRGAHVMMLSTLMISSAASEAEIRACSFDLKHSYVITFLQ